jgi:Aspartyl protease
LSRIARAAATGLLVLVCACGDGAPGAPIDRIEYDARTELNEPVVLSLVGEGLPAIDVVIAGYGRARFLVDSAMELTLLDRDFAKRCRLPVRSYAFELSIQTPSMALARVERAASVERLEFGAARAYDLALPLVDLQSVLEDTDGILGQDVLGDWALLFRPERRELVLLPSDSLEKRLAAFLPAGTRMESIPVHGEDRIMNISFDITGGPAVDLHVDTGSTSCTLPMDALARLGLSDPGTPSTSTSLSGKQTRPAWKVSGFPLGTQRLDLVLEGTQAAHGLLGWNALSQRTFVLDGPGRRVMIEASAVAPPPDSTR